MIIRSDFVNNDTISHLLWALTPTNKIICELCLQTGWRVDDVLRLKTEDIKNAQKTRNGRITITEQKTKKRSTKYLSKELLEALARQGGRVWLFEGRDDYRKHRSRQAVFKDLKKTAKNFRVNINLSPHSLRKNYAVSLRQQGKDLNEIQNALNHDNLITTMIYALADEMTNKYK